MSISKRQALLAERTLRHDSIPNDVSYLEGKAPVLLEMLTSLPKGASGDKTTSILFFCEDGEFKILINDRAVGRKAWLRVPTFDELIWQHLEECVADECTDWKFPKLDSRA